MTESFKVIKLKGRENYDTWAIAAQSYLVTKGLWEYIADEDVGTPTPAPAPAPANPPANQPERTNQQER